VYVATADQRALALQVNPRLREMQIRVAQAAKSERVAALGIRPMWSFSFGYMLRQPVEMDPMSGDDMWSATVGITLPWLYRRDKVDEEVRGAKAQQEAAARELEAMQNEVSGMVEEMVIDIQRADEQLSLAETGLLPQAEGAYAASRSSYATGKGEVLDLLMNQMNLYNLELQRVMLLMQRERAIADLAYTVGGSLTAPTQQSEVSGGGQ
jgi:outer membrane protein TolC